MLSPVSPNVCRLQKPSLSLTPASSYLSTSVFLAQQCFSKGPPFSPLHPDLSTHLLMPASSPSSCLWSCPSDPPHTLQTKRASGPIRTLQGWLPPAGGNPLPSPACQMASHCSLLTSHPMCSSCPGLSSHTSGSFLTLGCLPGTLSPGSPRKAQVLPPPGSLLSLYSLCGPPWLCHLDESSPQITLHDSGLLTHLPLLPG